MMVILEAQVARITGVNPGEVDRYTKDILEAQESKWGAPLANHLVYARRPTIFRGARAMWTGLDSSALIEARLRALINRRVATLNRCEF
jgi:alkylhydroperoxidase family enzyme